jgi:hypothetical protein
LEVFGSPRRKLRTSVALFGYALELRTSLAFFGYALELRTSLAFFGYAAGCEARLCLAGDFSKEEVWATPLVRALPGSPGQRPNRGRSPEPLLKGCAGEAEPRLTSGGVAEASLNPAA